jgi:hypothetical protein
VSEYEVDNKRTVVDTTDYKRIEELEKWFRYEYRSRLDAVNRYNYLGIPCVESRYTIEIEAYEKEQELRQLKGLAPLPEIKYTKLI